jgi:hypothetical protein
MSKLPLLRSIANHSDLNPDVEGDVRWGGLLNLGSWK